MKLVNGVAGRDLLGRRINILRSLPVTVRPVAEREAARTQEVVEIARQYGAAYFDGPREFGYGGYRWDGRWNQVARDVLEHYFPYAVLRDGVLSRAIRILDVGCAKGYLVRSLVEAGADAYGLDVSRYALVTDPDMSVVGRLHVGDACALPFPDDSFDLVVSINTLHNLTRDWLIVALREITRVSRGPAFVQVDSYLDEEGKRRFMDWVLTARFHDYPDGWALLFAEAGYVGDYDWTLV